MGTPRCRWLSTWSGEMDSAAFFRSSLTGIRSDRLCTCEREGGYMYARQTHTRTHTDRQRSRRVHTRARESVLATHTQVCMQAHTRTDTQNCEAKSCQGDIQMNEGEGLQVCVCVRVSECVCVCSCGVCVCEGETVRVERERVRDKVLSLIHI